MVLTMHDYHLPWPKTVTDFDSEMEEHCKRNDRRFDNSIVIDSNSSEQDLFRKYLPEAKDERS